MTFGLLDFIENDLAVDVDRDDFLRGADDFLKRLQQLLAQAREDMGEAPGGIFLTGGSSRSPHLQACVQACFPEIPLVCGEASLGVVSGLAVAAAG